MTAGGSSSHGPRFESAPRQLARPTCRDLSRPPGGDRGRARGHLRGARSGGDLGRKTAGSARRAPWRCGRDRAPGRSRVRGRGPRPDEARCGRAPDQPRPATGRARGAACADPAGPGPLGGARPWGRRGGPAAARRARSRRPLLPDSDQRHVGAGAPRRPDVRESPVERGRVGVQPRRRPRRPLALLPAAASRRRPLDPDAVGDLRDRRGRPRRLRRRSRRRGPRRRPGHARLAGNHAADAAAGRGR